MTEYILRLINPCAKVAVLSRGYGRKTKGFKTVETTATAEEVGDEPLQIKRKFPENTVVVCEDRCLAIENIRRNHDAILLDDAFQHRKLRPSFSILLFDFSSLQHPVLPLPTGNFRDNLYESSRANIIIITKCPDMLDSDTRFRLQAKFQKYSQAPVFFSTISYSSPIDKKGTRLNLTDIQRILLVTGIANPAPLLSYIQHRTFSVKHLAYADHHNFSESDIAKIEAEFQKIEETDKIILTTEKDFQRLPKRLKLAYPVFYIPIQQKFLFNQSAEFENILKRAFAC